MFDDVGADWTVMVSAHVAVSAALLERASRTVTDTEEHVLPSKGATFRTTTLDPDSVAVKEAVVYPQPDTETTDATAPPA